jgi:hypothetical protein
MHSLGGLGEPGGGGGLPPAPAGEPARAAAEAAAAAAGAGGGAACIKDLDVSYFTRVNRSTQSSITHR